MCFTGVSGIIRIDLDDLAELVPSLAYPGFGGVEPLVDPIPRELGQGLLGGLGVLACLGSGVAEDTGSRRRTGMVPERTRV